MSELLLSITETLLLVSALSLDAFVSAFSYGVNKIKIPLKSVLILNLICTGVLALSVFLGRVIAGWISESTTIVICFLLLFLMGLIKLFDSLLKGYIRKHKKLDKNIQFKFLSLRFLINIYADPEDADLDQSKTLSVPESVSLGIALSLDSLTVGIGIGVTAVNIWLLFAFSFGMGLLAVVAGRGLGEKIVKKTTVNLSWISGLIFILLAFSKLLP